MYHSYYVLFYSLIRVYYSIIHHPPPFASTSQTPPHQPSLPSFNSRPPPPPLPPLLPRRPRLYSLSSLQSVHHIVSANHPHTVVDVRGPPPAVNIILDCVRLLLYVHIVRPVGWLRTCGRGGCSSSLCTSVSQYFKAFCGQLGLEDFSFTATTVTRQHLPSPHHPISHHLPPLALTICRKPSLFVRFALVQTLSNHPLPQFRLDWLIKRSILGLCPCCFASTIPHLSPAPETVRRCHKT